jgi:protein subunit release factor A
MNLHLPPDVEMTFFKSPGPGGQHKNKTESGVRLFHRPTGIIVTATERRSQSQNRAVALERLQTRLENFYRKPAPRVDTRPTASSRKRRLETKTRRSRLKANRRSPWQD